MGDISKALVRDVAIVGMSCHLPGGVDDTRTLWEFCAQAKDSTSPIPKTRFNASNFYHPDKSKKGHFNVEGGSFLERDVGLFDAPFFNLSEAEAKSMDPQHRLLLESAFLAFENAGIDINSIAGRADVGVFAAGSQSDYQDRLKLDPYTGSLYTATGIATTMFANRISYFFNVRGPSITVDTACSSGLTALHNAVECIRSGQCSCVVVGGSFLQLLPQSLSNMCNLGTLSKAGKSFSFDHRANGYGRGEGAVCIVLKAAADAISANDSVRALIRNTGINHAGRSQGITFPNGQAQSELVARVYGSVGLDPRETVYVEGHGTGTERGDPIEAESIAAAFGGVARGLDNPIYLGSVKSNFGHLETVSGLLSVVKCVLMLERKVILPNANFEKSNPLVNLEKLNLKVPTECIPWPSGTIRRASINNFGFGGSNAHVILEQASDSLPPSSADDAMVGCMVSNGKEEPVHRLFTVSAKDVKSLKSYLQSLVEYVEKVPRDSKTFLADLSYTLCCRRTPFQWRFATYASTQAQLVERLTRSIPIGRANLSQRLCFVFTGQGAQWPKMGVSLMRYPTYAKTIKEAGRILKDLGANWSLVDELSKSPDSSLMGEAIVSQPATTALQVALISLFASWGLAPVAVCGHSSGEIAAAYAAGLLNLPSAMSIAYHRGKVCAQLHRLKSFIPGAMMAVGAGPHFVDPLIGSLRDGLATIACYNSPSSVTVSGDRSALLELKEKLDKTGTFNRMLQVDVAYHSEQMTWIAKQYLQEITPALTSNASKDATATFFSSVTGDSLASHVVRSPWYWATNLVCPVQFAKAVPAMIAAQASCHPRHSISLLEVGPHSALQGPVREMLLQHSSKATGNSPEYFPSLKRAEDGCQSVLGLVASLVARGFILKTDAIHGETAGESSATLLIDLPLYQFNKARSYWQDSRITSGFEQDGSPWHVLLGHKITSTVGKSLEFRNVFSLDDIPWLRDHRVDGNVVFPMAGYLSMAIEALLIATPKLQSQAIDGYRVKEMTIGKAFILSDGEQNELFTVLDSQVLGTRGDIPSRWHDFRILSWTKERSYMEHCRGSVCLVMGNTADSISEQWTTSTKLQHIEQLRSRVGGASPREVAANLFYERVAQKGISYGPIFRQLTGLRTGDDCAVGTVTGIDTRPLMPMEFETPLKVHPATLDAFLHTSLCNMGGNNGDPDQIRPSVPTFLREAFISNHMPQDHSNCFHVYFHDRQAEAMSRSTTGSLTIFSGDEKMPAIELRDLRSFEISEENAPEPHADVLNPLKLDWREHPAFINSSSLDDMEYPGVPLAEQEAEIMALEQQAYYLMKRAISASGTEVGSSRHLSLLRKWMDAVVAHVESPDASTREKEWTLLNESERTDFIEAVSSRTMTGKWNRSVGENLYSIITGQVAPLSILLAENGLLRIYEESFIFGRSGHQLAELVSLVARQNPTMRVLEVGAGTGGYTSKVLSALSSTPLLGVQCEVYDYTDVSTGFFDFAATKLERWKRVLKFRKLDISKDPVEQGFALGFYDIVIAGDVIHATSNPGQALSYVRQLLKPDGIFAMAELSRFNNALFPFATLPGWWERDTGAAVPESEWHELLLRAGFTGVEAAIRDFPASDLHKVYWTKVSSPQTRPILGTITLISNDEQLSENCFGRDVGTVLQQELGFELEYSSLAAGRSKDGVLVFLDDSKHPPLTSLDRARFQSLKKLLSEANAVLWVSRTPYAGADQEPHFGFVSGFMRTLRLENAGVKFVLMHLDASKHEHSAENIGKVFKHSFVMHPSDLETDLEFREEHGRIQVPRLIPDERMYDLVDRESNETRLEQQDLWQDGRSLEVTMSIVGLFSTLHFQDSDVFSQKLADDEVIIEIKATGMNFKDVLIALGTLPWQGLGRECSGVIVAAGKEAQARYQTGDAVVHWGGSLFATHVRCKMTSIVKMPDNLSFMEAASIPIVFATAYASLIDSARLRKNETVLIHAAAGGVGQAAVMIAQWVGAEVFCTVGSPEKKDHIMRLYNIPETHIFSSRSTTFADALLIATHMKGVDVILNSLSGDLLRSSWECLAPFGRFIDIGKRDAVANASLEMAPFEKGVSYSAIDLSLYIDRRETDFCQLMGHVMKLVATMAVRPVQPIQCLSTADLETGLRTMQAGKHIGKIVITNSREARVKARCRPSYPIGLHPDFSYLISGGVGGLGKSLVDLFLRDGAKNIILASRSASEEASRGAVEELLKQAAAKGARILPVKCDVGSAVDVQNMIATAAQQGMPPVRGVVHGAMVLKDALFETSTFDEWQAVLTPKVKGAMNLHTVLDGTPLDFFVCLSSVAGALGNAGQASYAGSNSFLDAFCRWRGRKGLPAASINLPAVQDVGYVAESVARGATSFDADIYGFSITGADLQLLIKAIVRGGLMSFNQNGNQVLVGPSKRPEVGNHPRLRHAFFTLVRHSVMTQTSNQNLGVATIASSSTGGRSEILVDKEALKHAVDIGEASKIVFESLAQKLAKEMTISPDDIALETSLTELGLDSLIAVGFRNWIATELKANVPVMDIVGSGSVNDLVAKVMQRSTLLVRFRDKA